MAGQQQQPSPAPPVFRAQVDAVELDVFATDASGNPVLDLTADDFDILEDGRPQTIAAFSLVNIPLERLERPLFSPAAVEPDVFSNTRGEGRVYVIALDEVRPDLALRTRRFLRGFIEQQFAANDVAAVVFVGRGRAGDAQDFTSNKRLLLAAIDKFSGGFAQEGSPPMAGRGGEAPQPILGLPQTGTQSSGIGGDTQGVRSRMRALRDLTEFMATMRGRRKTMIYVTETLGDVFEVLDYNGGARSIAFDDLHAAITAATRGNVSIYPVDPRGLSADGGGGETEAAVTVGGAGELMRLQELRAVAEATGGFALVNSNSFQGAFARIVRENSAYYVLGFSSTNERRDGRFRRLQVRVRRPGVVVRTRSGYLAPLNRGQAPREARDTAALPSPIAESLAVPLANPAVPMRMFAAPFKGSEGRAQVAIAVELDASALGLTEKDGTWTGEVTVVTTAVAASGQVYRGQVHNARFALRADRWARAKQDGVRVLSELQLPPGRYQLRAAGGSATGPAGSVIADLEVPDYSREPLVMSGVALTSSALATAPTGQAVPMLAGILPGAIIARRDFTRDDTLAMYVEVYENGRRAPHTVDIKVELRTDDGRVVFSTTENRSSKELGGRAGGYGFSTQIPLADAAPGIHVLHVEATANIDGRPTVARDVQLTVK